MSSLSQYHPFRDSVNKTIEGAVGATAEPVTNKDDKNTEYKPWLTFKAKMRLVLACLSFLVLWYVLSSFFSDNPEIKGGFYSSIDKISNKNSSKSSMEGLSSVFDEHDLDDRGRSVSDTRSKAGFLSSLFCRGGKKASFCD